MTTFQNISYQDLKEAAAEFFRRSETADADMLECGFKALTLLYLAADQLSELEESQAHDLLSLAARRLDSHDAVFRKTP